MAKRNGIQANASCHNAKWCKANKVHPANRAALNEE